MRYFDEIRELTKLIPTTIVDFSQERNRTSPPTQAFDKGTAYLDIEKLKSLLNIENF